MSFNVFGAPIGESAFTADEMEIFFNTIKTVASVKGENTDSFHCITEKQECEQFEEKENDLYTFLELA